MLSQGWLRSRAPTKLAVLLLALLLLAADTLAWMHLQQVLSRRMQRIAATLARSGWQLDAAPARRGGWPLAASLDLPTLHLHGGERLLPGGLDWTGERVGLSISLLHPLELSILLHGAQLVSGDAACGVHCALRVSGAGLAVRLGEAGAPDAARLDGGAVRLALPGAGADQVLRIGSLHGVLRWNNQAQALRLTLERLTLPPEVDLAGLAFVPRAELEASYADQAGRLLVRKAELRWNDAAMALQGEAVLHPAGPADGAFSVRISGAEALLDRAVAAHRMNPTTASAIRAVLELIAAGRGADTTPLAGSAAGSANPPAARLPPLTLPLELHDGELWLGRIPLLRLPAWPASAASGNMLPSE